MPADWKTNSTAQTRRGFVLQHLCEEEMRSFWDVLPTHRCEGGNVTFLPRCIVWSAGAEQSREALHRPSQYKLHSWLALGALFQSATGGQYKGTEHPLIPGARARRLSSLHSPALLLVEVGNWPQVCNCHSSLWHSTAELLACQLFYAGREAVVLMWTSYSPDIAGFTFLMSCNSSCTMHNHSESRQSDDVF